LGAAETDVALDESVFTSTNSQGYESLKKIKKNRMDLLKIKETTEKAFQLVENRDALGLIRHLK